jgi:hypothetical protein
VVCAQHNLSEPFPASCTTEHSCWCNTAPNIAFVQQYLRSALYPDLWLCANATQGTIGSTFFQQVHSIIQSPDKLPTILGAALPDSSNFFMQFIAMRALFLIWLRLCVPHGGVWQNWLHYCCCPRFCCSTCNTGKQQQTVRHKFLLHMCCFCILSNDGFASTRHTPLDQECMVDGSVAQPCPLAN